MSPETALPLQPPSAYEANRDIVFMTLPLLALSTYFYGARPAVLCLTAAFTAMLCDHLVAWLRHRPCDKTENSSIPSALVLVLLLPATVALAIPLYEKLDLLKANAAAIIAGISVGTLVSLGSALALALALHLTQEQYATLLPKSVTTAISMDVAAELGGIAALTGAIVILTGIVGNLLAETVCKAFHITDPIAKGVGIGTSAHAVGTSKALQMGEVEGAMSGLSIAVAGVLTAVLCPVFVNLID